MAKNDNLTDFLTDVADAIREKKGTSDLINPQDFSAEIASIETGSSAPEDGVNFYDYDGTLLYHYSPEEALALTELPSGPDMTDFKHDGLIFDGWGQDLEDIVAFGGNLDIGAQYISNYYIYDMDLNHESLLTVPLNLIRSSHIPINSVIDWGDDTIEEFSLSYGNHVFSHTYKEKGIYKIKITYDKNLYPDYSKDNNGNYFGIFGKVFENNYITENIKYYNAVISYTAIGYQFYMYPNAKNAIFCYNIDDNSLRLLIGLDYNYLGNLNCMSIPKNYYIPTIRNFSTNKLLLGKNSDFNAYCFTIKSPIVYINSEKIRLNSSYYITKIIANKSPRDIYNCRGISHIILLEGCTLMKISYNDIYVNIHLPSTITNIYSLNQGSSDGSYKVYLDKLKQIPIIDSSRYLNYDTMNFYVPKNSFYDYLNATNWADRPNKIYPIGDNIIKFKIDTVGYFIAKRITTWEEWMNSDEYNGNFSIVDGVVMHNNINNVQYNNKNVLATDIIYGYSSANRNKEYTILVNETTE